MKKIDQVNTYRTRNLGRPSVRKISTLLYLLQAKYVGRVVKKGWGQIMQSYLFTEMNTSKEKKLIIIKKFYLYD